MCSNNMHTLSMCIVTYLNKYLGEFKFLFEPILDYESGDQMGSFDVKNPPSKISCLGTCKAALAQLRHFIPEIEFRGWQHKARTSVKVHHAQKSLKFLDCLEPGKFCTGSTCQVGLEMFHTGR
jgi:hypothetical protein